MSDMDEFRKVFELMVGSIKAASHAPMDDEYRDAYVLKPLNQAMEILDNLMKEER